MGVRTFLERLGLTRSAPRSGDARLEAFWEGANVATYRTKLEDLAGVKEMLATAGEERARLLVQCTRLFGRDDQYWTRSLIGALFKELADPRFPYSADDLTEVVSFATTPQVAQGRASCRRSVRRRTLRRDDGASARAGGC